MNFGKVLSTLGKRLTDLDIDWAVVGGLGLALYGMPRTTLDIDLMVDGEAQEAVLSVLEDLGFQCLHRSTGYSNHRHEDSSWGQVDVLYVRGETKRQVLEAPIQLKGPGGMMVPVARPEHLIAMKVFAMQQNPARQQRELADIRGLAELAGISSDTVRNIFARYSAEEVWDDYQS